LASFAGCKSKRNADIFLFEDVTNIDYESWADYLGDAPAGDGRYWIASWMAPPS